MTHFCHEGKSGLCRDGFSYKEQGRSNGSEYETMRTYTHGVIGYLLYAKRPRHEQRLAIMGSILPDVFLALGFVAHYLENFTHSAMAAELHTLLHHSVLHTVTIAMHSFVLVGPCLALSSLFYRPALPFFVADVRSYRSVEDGPLLDSRDNTTVFRPSYFDDYESH